MLHAIHKQDKPMIVSNFYWTHIHIEQEDKSGAATSAKDHVINMLFVIKKGRDKEWRGIYQDMQCIGIVEKQLG